MEFEKVIIIKYRDIKRNSVKYSTQCAKKEEFYAWLGNSSKAKNIVLNHSITGSMKDTLCIYRASLDKGYVINNLKISTYSDFIRFYNWRVSSEKISIFERDYKYRVSKRGILYRYYYDRFKDSKITKNKFISTLAKDKSFLTFYKKYKDSGYLKSLKPRIVLKNKNKPKTLRNIMFTTNYNRSKV